MNVKTIKKEVFTKLVDKLISEGTVYGPTPKRDRFNFEKLDSAADLRMDYDVTLHSPKKYFQPTCESLLKFKVKGEAESVFDDSKFTVIGVHPYDMVALNQMAEIFSQGEYDSHYMTRRKNATIIASDVVTASKDVFAGSIGTATVDSGFDVLLTDIGDSYVAEAASEKGEQLLSKADEISDATEADLAKRAEIQKVNKAKLKKHELKCKATFLPRLLERAYDHPVFDEKAKTCFSCGSCTQVCPTCYCFDVQDMVNWDLQTGERMRKWDGCLLDGFTKCAPSHEFRKNRADRFRHRIFRKGKYVPGKLNGQIACVGCGRCVSACLPDIANPVAIYNRLVEDLGLI